MPLTLHQAQNQFLASVTALLDQNNKQAARKLARKAAETADPYWIAEWRRMWPTIPSRVIMVLADSGLRPDSPVAEKLGTAASKMRAVEQQRQDYEDFQQGGFNFNPLKAVAEGVHVIAPGVARGGLAFLTAGLSEAPSIGGEIRQGVGIGVKPVARTAALAANTPLEAVQASVRDFAGDISRSPLTLGVGAPEPNAPPDQNFLQRARFNVGELGGQTQAGQAISALTSGRPVDVGAGWLPDYKSKTAEAAAEAARQASPYLVGGHAWTLGRAAADTVGLEPDTDPFNAVSGFIDAVAALQLDPTNAVFLGLGEAAKARKVFAGVSELDAARLAEAGVTRSPKPTVTGWIFENWRETQPQAQRLVNYLAENTDFEKARHIFNGDVYMATRTVDAGTADEVASVMRNAIQDGYLREVPRMPKVGYRVQSSLGHPRWASDIPTNFADLKDPSQFVDTYNSVQRNARLPQKVISGNNEELARVLIASQGNIGAPGVMGKVGDIVDQVAMQTIGMNLPGLDATTIPSRAYVGYLREGKVSVVANNLMKDTGLDANLAHRAANLAKAAVDHTRLYMDDFAKKRIYDIDHLTGEALDPGWARVGNELHDTVRPTKDIYFLNEKVPTPDTRYVKDMTGWMRGIWRVEPDLTAAKKAIAGAVIGGAAGYAADPEDPKSWALGALAGATYTAAHKLPVTATRRYLDYAMTAVFKPLVLATRPAWTVRVVGEEQIRMGADGLDSVLSGHPLRGIIWAVSRPQGSLLKDGQFVDIAAESLNTGLTDEYARALTRPRSFVADPVLEGRRAIALSDWEPIDATHKDFYHWWANELATAHTSAIDKNIATHIDNPAEFFVSEPGAKILERMARDPSVASHWAALGNDPVTIVDDYITNRMTPNLNLLTGGDDELLDVVKTGKFRGNPIMQNTRHGPKFNEEFVKALTEEKDWLAPNYVKGKRTQVAYDRVPVLDRVTNFLFDHLMSKPTNFLSRSPAFRQFYWQRHLELMDRASASAQAQILRAAEGAGRLSALPHELRRGLADAATRGTGELTVKQIDGIAKAYALDNVQHLLYDLSKKNQVSDSLRLIFPFGEAFKEIVTEWASIISQNPHILRRFQQGVEAAKESGFFHYDPQLGQQVFNYVGADRLAGLTGAGPVLFQADPNALNMAGQGYPGFGPLPQLAVRELLPKKPSFDTFRKVIDPYGDQENQGLLLDTIDSVTPAWSRYVKSALVNPESSRLWAATVSQIRAYKYSTGDYPPTPDGRRRLLEESKAAATPFLLLRAMFSSTMPAAATPSIRVRDKNGHYATIRALADELHNLEQDKNVGYDRAPMVMIKQYGEKAINYLVQATSRPNVLGLPTTDTGEAWIRTHPDIKAKAPNTFGMFAPRAGEFDTAIIGRQLRTGQRETLTPEAQEQLANDRIARARYNHERSKMSTGEITSTGGQQYLADLKDYLIGHYPGAFSPVGIKSRATANMMITELRDVIHDPALRDNEVAKAVRRYLSERDAGIKQVGVRGWQTAKAGAGFRSYLADLQAFLRKKYPDSATVFDIVFDNDIQGVG